MEQIIKIETDYGVLEGRDSIYLDKLNYLTENQLLLEGEFNTNSGFIKYAITFSGVLYLKSVELDYYEGNQLASFGFIQNSRLIKRLKKLDHSNKLGTDHKHYYFKTYDTAFEIVSSKYSLQHP